MTEKKPYIKMAVPRDSRTKEQLERDFKDCSIDLQRSLIGLYTFAVFGDLALARNILINKSKMELKQLVKAAERYIEDRTKTIHKKHKDTAENIIQELFLEKMSIIATIVDLSNEIRNYDDADIDYLMIQFKTLIIHHNAKKKADENSGK